MGSKAAAVLAAVAIGIAMLAFSVGPNWNQVLTTLASMTGTGSNASNQLSNKSLVSPTALTATDATNSVTLSWTAPSPNDGNGYALWGHSNGTSSTCPTSTASYTYLAGSSTTGYTDTGTVAQTAGGSYACYAVQTGYSSAGGPPWASAPQWTSQGTLLTAVVATNIAFRQKSPEKTGGSTVKPALASGSLAGSLLVATVGANDTTKTFTGPAGWTLAVRTTQAGLGALEIWYLANAAANTTNGTWKDNAASVMAAQITEFTGVVTTAPLDQTGSVSVGSASKTATAADAAAVTINGELSVTAFISGAPGSYTSQAGWTNLVRDTTLGYVSDYEAGQAAGTPSEQMTAANPVLWAGAIASFK